MEPLEQQPPVVIEKPKDPPREKLINTAVAFLKLPQVQASPLKGKQEFLRSKGLTDEEVRISCEIAGAFDQVGGKNQNAFISDISSNNYALIQQVPQRQWLFVIKDVASIAAIVVGIFFMSQAIYQKYLQKYFANNNKKDRKSVQESQSDMIIQMKSDVTEQFLFVQSKLTDLDTKISKLVQNQESQDLENQINNKQIEDLRGEVLSLKGLLLNRKQFPTPSILPSGGTPSIPSWQLKHDSPKSTGSGSGHQDSIESSKHTSDHSEGSEPEIISKDNGSNGSDSSLEIVK
uniref:Peroxisomal membrane protein PEX14 n=1 Tax=Cacopsylla melanoneura TaxID=428564 RepID=A0A8D8R470_9HEMI